MTGINYVGTQNEKGGGATGTPAQKPNQNQRNDYLRMISTRRFCGSRTPLAVGTSGWVSP
jgi:hypothetical protein